MEIRNHETNDKFIIVSNPTVEAVKLAKQLERDNWAKIRPSGEIVVNAFRRREFDALLPKKPVAKPVPVAESNSELEAKIKKYEAEIADLEAHISTLDQTNVFRRIERVETLREIRAIQEKIENLRKRIAGIPTSTSTVTDEQIALSDYVLSDKYNDD